MSIHLRLSADHRDEVLLLTSHGVQFCSIKRDLEYQQFPGGHTGPVISVHELALSLPLASSPSSSLNDFDKIDFKKPSLVSFSSKSNNDQDQDQDHGVRKMNDSCFDKEKEEEEGEEDVDEYEDEDDLSDLLLQNNYNSNGNINNASKIFSASLDNTIRQWDAYDLSCQRVLEEYDSEISCMCLSGVATAMISNNNYNNNSDLKVVTGHDDGCVRIWEVDTGSTINIKVHLHSLTNYRYFRYSYSFLFMYIYT